MNRSDLRSISAMRMRDAKVLLDAGRDAGAYYLMGYSVECALKACIAGQVRRGDFPDKKLAEGAWIHDLEKLVAVAGLKVDFEADRKKNAALELNWAIVKDWNELARYEVTKSAAEAKDLYNACTGRNGILPWVKKRW